MDRTAIILVLSSCVTHAVWNLLSKKSSKTPAFFWLGALLTLVPLTPVFFWLGGARMLAAAPLRLWLLLPATGCFLCVYYGCLAAAYRHGDVSATYPLIRTAPIFVLVLAGLILGQRPAPLAVAGIVLVVAGCFALPLKRLKLGPGGVNWRAYLNRASFWALGAALGSAGYTLIDDVAMDAVKSVAPELRGAFFYEYLQYAALVIGLLIVSLLSDGPGRLARVCREEWPGALTVGSLVFATYMLILWAYTHAEKVAYVAGLRQLSIVLGVIGGVLFFREPGGRVRIAASMIIVAGLIMIGFAR